MASIYTHTSKNIQKTWILVSVFFVIVIGLGWFFSYLYNAPEILVIAVFFSVAMNVVSYWKSDALVLSMSGAKPVSRREFPDLYNTVENLAITAGLPLPKIYIMDDPALNAFATGRDPEHAVVAVTSGLLRALERDELEGVIAHELSHIGNRDMLLSTMVVVLVGFITLLSDFFLRSMLFGRGGDDRSGGGQIKIILLIVGVVLAILSPLVATLIRLAVSRNREFLADASGAMLTRYPEGLAKALEKISATGIKMRKANNATAHLFISDPFGKKSKKRWLHNLFLTHPPAEQRIAALRGMGK
jgi:heat shock protein HtpX